MAQCYTAVEVNTSIVNEIEHLKQSLTVTPKLVTLRLGESGADMAYERNATAKMKKFGFEVDNLVHPTTLSQDKLLEILRELDQDSGVHGILLFQPLPPHIDIMAVRHALSPIKDIDCTSIENLGLILSGNTRYAPCAPAAVMALLNHYDIGVAGKNITIIGSSLVVGRPLSMLLSTHRATITVCNQLTPDVADEARKADILITGTGSPYLVNSKFVHPEQIVIDVGTTMVDGALCGDVSPEVYDLVKGYTPTPRGVGGITTTILAKHLVEATLHLTAKK